MAKARMEGPTDVVTMSRERFEALDRDRMILDLLERTHKRMAPGRPALRETAGGLIDSKRRMERELADGCREVEARKAAIRADAATATPPAPSGADAAGIRETPERRRRAGR